MQGRVEARPQCTCINQGKVALKASHLFLSPCCGLLRHAVGTRAPTLHPFHPPFVREFVVQRREAAAHAALDARNARYRSQLSWFPDPSDNANGEGGEGAGEKPGLSVRLGQAEKVAEEFIGKKLSAVKKVGGGLGVLPSFFVWAIICLMVGGGPSRWPRSLSARS
jgi:hypothetical protein